MSFYWQNAVPQESGHPNGSTWDNINLGNTPPQQQQPAQQSFSYENQQVAGGNVSQANPYADQWAAYYAQQAALQEQQQQPQAHQPATVAAQIEHQPIFHHQSAVDSTVSVPTNDQTAQESQSNHTAYDGWGSEGWSSHEPSVEPQVQPTAQAHQYYAQQQQYYQEQIPQQPAAIEQNWTPSEATVSSTTATIVESAPPSMVELAPVEVAPVGHQEPSLPSPQPVQYHTQPSAPAAVFDMGFGDEMEQEKQEEDGVEMKQAPREELAEDNGGEWGEGWGEEAKEHEKEEKEEEREVLDSSHLNAPQHDQPRTSTPSPAEEHHEEPEPAVSPIETAIETAGVEQQRESAPSPSPIPVPAPVPSAFSGFPSPPTILTPSELAAAAAPPPSSSQLAPSTIDTHSVPLSPAELNRLQTDNTQKTSPPASTDSWVEVSSSGSDAVQLLSSKGEGGRGGMGADGVPPLASSSPARPEKRSSVSSVNGLENGVERRRDDSDSTHDSKRNVRDKFRDVKSQYGAIFARLSEHRSSTGRDGNNKTPTRLVNPLLAANGSVRLGGPLSVGGAATTAKNSSTPKEFHADSTYPPPLHSDISAIGGDPRMYGHHLDHSGGMNMSMESSHHGYGEDLVDARRQERHRAARSSRPVSRARSEYGDPVLMPDRGDRHNRSAYEHSLQMQMHPQYAGYYPTGRYSLGRHSSMGMPYAVDAYENARLRPHSTYDQAAHLRMARSGRGAEYDAFEYVSSGEESEEEEEELPNESDNEMRRISAAAAAAHSRSSIGLVRGGPGGPRGPLPMPAHPHHHHLGHAPIERLGEEEISYLGFVNMNLNQARGLLYKYPPPPEFWTHLGALQKVAFLYYTSLHKKNFSYAAIFGERFMEKYLPLKRMGYPPEKALAKVCEEMREHHRAKMASSQRAYEASQRQLFSDEYDRGTPESRFSDRPSVYDHNQTSDVDDGASTYALREPLKFRLPHAFATFGPGGKIIQVQPGKSVGTVYITDVHCIVRDREMQRNVALASNFKGPLFPNQTPPHVVRAYILRQMERIKRSDLAQTDPRNDDIIDCLLIWQLLERVVTQHGRVTGPDMAELLTRASNSNKKRGGGGGENNSLEIAPPTPDPKAYETFCQYLLQGLVDDAISFAMGEGLYSDALSLARRLVPARVEEIEKRHFATRPASHPVLTLMAVASEEAAPCLSSMASEERGGWRCHAAILFANLSASPFAMETIRRLGEELARRDCQAAADFCFLSVALLAGVDTFTPTTHDPVTGLPPSVRRHIELIHASIPDDIAESTLCEYGFSLTDLHATEIFDYGSRLSGGATNLAISAPYQRRRLQYARLLAGWGGFALDAFRYCTEVARTMWEKMSLFTTKELEELTELADRLHRVAAADEESTLWIAALRQTIPSIRTAMYAPAFECEKTAAPAVPAQEETREEREEHRPRSDSISTEAAAWHSRMGEEPLEMRGGGGGGGGEATEERRSEERRGGDTEGTGAMYAQYNQQYQQQQEYYGGEERRQSDAYHNHEQPTHASHSAHSGQSGQSASAHSAHSAHSGQSGSYSSGSTTERGGGGGASSEESTPTRERSASIHSQYSHGTAPLPNPLAPPAAMIKQEPVPAPPMGRAPAPMPPMPALSITPAAPTTIASASMMPPMQPQLIKQETASQQQQQPPPLSQSGGGGKGSNGGGGGLFGAIGAKFKTTLSRAVGNKEMILPDDSKKAIIYDEKLKRYVGDGVEEETAPPPPPSVPGSMNGLAGLDGAGGGAGGPPPMMGGGGLKAARNSGGSRYFNPLNDASNRPSNGGPSGGGGGMGGVLPPTGMPAPPTFPTQFSFIPTMPDDAVTDSPFSERPAVPEGADGQQQEHSQQ